MSHISRHAQGQGNAASRRTVLAAALLGASSLLPLAAHAADAKKYPERPVRVVVGFSAGGTTDVVARIMAKELTAELGQSFVIDNKPGAGSNIATELVARAVETRPAQETQA